VEGESTLHLIKFFQEYLLLESISTRYLGGAGVGPGQEGYAIDFREKRSFPELIPMLGPGLFLT